jgi:hypothetical protein
VAEFPFCKCINVFGRRCGRVVCAKSEVKKDGE